MKLSVAKLGLGAAESNLAAAESTLGMAGTPLETRRQSACEVGRQIDRGGLQSGSGC
jgi:hypothetical protein